MSHLHPILRNNFRAGSSTMIGRESFTDTRAAQASPGSSCYGPSDSCTSNSDTTRDSTRDNRTSGVNFDPKDIKGIQPTMISLPHISCDCDAQDIYITYRMCCVTVDDSPSCSAATLFDTGAHTSSSSPRQSHLQAPHKVVRYLVVCSLTYQQHSRTNHHQSTRDTRESPRSENSSVLQ